MGMRSNLTAAIMAGAFIIASTGSAFATQDVSKYVNAHVLTCFEIRDASGKPTDGPLWTVTVTGGTRQLGTFKGSGCVEIQKKDVKLRAGIRDSDKIKVTKESLLP